MNWKGKRVLVTGGTSSIGSSLADAFVSQGIIKTIDWHVKNRNPDEVRCQLQSMLTER